MSHIAPLRSVPRAHRDPITNPHDALLLVLFLLDPSPDGTAMIITVDDTMRGLGVLSVTGVSGPQQVLSVIDYIAEASYAHPDVSGLLVASTHPTSSGLGVADLEAWHDADLTCRDAGLELVEWFVVGSSVSCPRELGGIPARWPQ